MLHFCVFRKRHVLNPLHQQLIKLLEKPEWSQSDRKQIVEILEKTDPTEAAALIKKLSSEKYAVVESVSYKMLDAIHRDTHIEQPGKIRKLWGRRLPAAAAIILVVISTVWWFSGQRKSNTQVAAVNRPAEVMPGGNKAILRLANGTTVVLDSLANGTIASQGSVMVIKSADGQLAYQPSSSNAGSSSVQFNNISTPRGGQYQVQLADGSRVWLNAESSLEFPAAFTGGERRVKITGEAYFEITKNKEKPFIVQKGDVEVKVLGTHFNVNAYDGDESMKITLIEGSVKITIPGKSALLRPGQQAMLSSADMANYRMQIINNVDVDAVVAWKNGFFQFQNSSMKEVMGQISRWYDVDAAFNPEVHEGHYTGSIRRSSSLSQVLKMLEVAGDVHFSIVGKQIIIK